MLIVAGHIATAPGHRDAFIDAIQQMIPPSLAEPGCREYVFTPDPNDETKVRVFEMWDDQDALDAHFASDHMKAWQADRGEIEVTGAEVNKYEVTDMGPLR